MNKSTCQLYHRLALLGFTDPEIWPLRSIARTLHRWDELECGTDRGRIERDEETGKPSFHSSGYHTGKKWVEPSPIPIPDREAGALRRLAKLMGAHPDLIAYHQGDCRGASLYILRKSDVLPGEDVDSVYARGVAIAD